MVTQLCVLLESFRVMRTQQCSCSALGILTHSLGDQGPENKVERGKVEEWLSKCDHTLAGSVVVGSQDHFYLEPQVSVVQPQENDELVIHASTQVPCCSSYDCVMILYTLTMRQELSRDGYMPGNCLCAQRVQPMLRQNTQIQSWSCAPRSIAQQNGNLCDFCELAKPLRGCHRKKDLNLCLLLPSFTYAAVADVVLSAAAGGTS